MAPGQNGEGKVASITRSTGGNTIESTKLFYDVQAKVSERDEYLGASNVPSRKIAFAYDSLGYLSRTYKYQFNSSTPAFARDQFHDVSGSTTAVADENHANPTSTPSVGSATTTSDYDALGRLVAVHQQNGNQWVTTTYGYDSNDNLTKVIDGDGRITNYLYDDFGELSAVISPDSGTTHYTYDNSGNMIGKRDAAGVTTTYTYDVANRRSSVSRTDGTTVQNEIYAYDSCRTGFLCSVTDASGETVFSYDALGRLANESRLQGSVVFSTAYAYDALGRIASLTYPSGRVVSYIYSGTDPSRVIEIDSTYAATVTPLVTNVAYDVEGAPLSWRLPDGNTVVASRDFAGQITSLVSPPALSATYQLDGVGNILEWRDSVRGNAAFDYDEFYRLTSVPNPIISNGAPETWTYDNSGNRLSDSTNLSLDEKITYAYAPGTDTLTSLSGDADGFTYNGRGDAAQMHGASFSYDPSGRLSRAIGARGDIADYAYNYRFQ